MRHVLLAEGQGFEPWVRGYPTMVFKTISLGRSDSPPARARLQDAT